MEDGFRLQESRIAIIGLGLMGGSLALALKGKCAALYGIDMHHATLKLALDKKIVDQADNNPANLLPEADLVILAKRLIIEAMSRLPERFDPIGGHPICGKERLGLENADAGLFQNVPFVISPLQRTTHRARNSAEQIVTAVNANLIEMNSDEHDHVLAFTSHLPFIISSALIETLPPKFEGLIGTGFRSTSRLAGTPSHMMMGVLQSNRENILFALRKFQEQLASIETAISAKSDSPLETILNSAQSHYQSLVH